MPGYRYFFVLWETEMTDCQVLPGGALLGPPITPMTAEEEATARKRVGETLTRLNAHSPSDLPRHYPEKFSGIERVAALLRAAPPAVRSAWILNKGFTRIAFYPNGYTTMDSCGCCFDHHPPGWYLGKVRISSFFGIRCEDVFWTPICGPDGGPMGKTESWDILESH